MNTRVYKRTVLNIIKNTLYTLLSPVALFVFVYFILSLFKLDGDISFWISVGLSVLVMLMFLKSLFVTDRIVISVNDKGLTYKSGSKETFYTFEDCKFGYQSVSSSGTTDTINLYVYRGDAMTLLNCEPLGPRQFAELYESLKNYTADQTIQKLN